MNIRALKIVVTATILLTALAALLVGCGGGGGASAGVTSSQSSNSPSATNNTTPASTSPAAASNYSSAQSIVAALRAAGKPCTEVQRGIEGTPVGPTPMDEATCQFDGEQIRIDVYQDQGAAQNAEGLGKTMGCSVGKALGYTHLYAVEKGAWAITVLSGTDTKTLADALHAQAVTINCG